MGRTRKFKEDAVSFAIALRTANCGRKVYEAAKEALHIFEPLGNGEKKLVSKLKRAIRRFEQADR